MGAYCARCQRFVKNNGFAARKARQVDVGRLQCASDAAVIRHYIGMLIKLLTDLNLLDKPECIHNCDEKGWSKQQQLQQPVIVTRGRRQV